MIAITVDDERPMLKALTDIVKASPDIDEVYEVIKPFVKHVHLKDAVREDGKTKIRTLGEGNIDIVGIISRLLNGGYDGYFSFEHEKVWHKELPEPEVEFPKFVNYMKNVKAV